MVGVAEYQLHLEYAITPFFPILEMDLHKMLFIPFACIASPVPQPHPRSAAVPNGVPGLALAKGNLVELAYTLKMQFLQNWAKKKKKSCSALRFHLTELSVDAQQHKIHPKENI